VTNDRRIVEGHNSLLQIRAKKMEVCLQAFVSGLVPVGGATGESRAGRQGENCWSAL